MISRITIPNISREERIGSAFNHLFSIISQSEMSGGTEIWDFFNTKFFHPFFIGPLAIYRDNVSNYKNIQYSNIPPYISSYLSVIKFFDFLDVTEESHLKDILQYYKEKTYIPICRFDLNAANNIDNMQSIIQDVIISQRKIDEKLKTPLSYLFGELICNMQQHSNAKYGYLFSQYLKEDNCLYICLADNGITIYGSYMRANKYIEDIQQNEALSLKFATLGYSTKNRPEAEDRGYGISTNTKMIVEGLGGAFFILSGGAFHRKDSSNNVFINLPQNLSWNGTIILVKIPLSINPNFDYYSYII